VQPVDLEYVRIVGVALEIFNGKRFELNHSYRIPEVLPPPPLPDNIPPAGTILRDKDGRIAFPGGFDDWYQMLNKGLHFTATGNSDSHGWNEEAGYPRTYTPVFSSSDQAGQIDQAQVAAALKTQQAYVTNGPLITVAVNGVSMGQIANGTKGTANVVIDTKMANWVDIDTIKVVLNSTVVATRTGDKTTLAHLEIPLQIAHDSWVVVEVSGSKSLWPVVSPHEIPPVQISDAIGALGTSFGFASNPYGNLGPTLINKATPLAFNNPIYIDFDGDGKYTPVGVKKQNLVSSSAAAAAGDPGLLDPSYRLNIAQEALEVPLLVKLFAEFAGH
jgi:hypothetical protein